jgi:hypothetical protein
MENAMEKVMSEYVFQMIKIFQPPRSLRIIKRIFLKNNLNQQVVFDLLNLYEYYELIRHSRGWSDLKHHSYTLHIELLDYHLSQRVWKLSLYINYYFMSSNLVSLASRVTTEEISERRREIVTPPSSLPSPGREGWAESSLENDWCPRHWKGLKRRLHPAGCTDISYRFHSSFIYNP